MFVGPPGMGAEAQLGLGVGIVIVVTIWTLAGVRTRTSWLRIAPKLDRVDASVDFFLMDSMEKKQATGGSMHSSYMSATGYLDVRL